MKQFMYIPVVLLSVFGLAACNAEEPAQTPLKKDRPRLVLEIVVDQLRGDMPAMVMDRLASG
ncbi:MAG: hypothetical protein KAS94_14150, partial [Desulfobulbaceae bacterium]|nr:hypothetical protein [Desulfobulbaceae bacterium]